MSRLPGTWLVGLVATLALALWASPGVAQAAPPQSEVETQTQVEPAARRVRVVVAGTPDRRAASLVVLRELLGRLDVAPEFLERDSLDVEGLIRGTESAEGYLAQIHIELSHEPLTMYVIDGPCERILIRRVSSEGAFGEVEREEIATIAEAAVLALLDGGRIGVSREVAQAELGATAQAGREVGATATVTRSAPELVEAGEPTPAGPPRDIVYDPNLDRRGGSRGATQIGVSADLVYAVSVWSFRRAPLQGPALGLSAFASEYRTSPGIRLATHLWLPQRVPTESGADSGAALAVWGLGVRAMLSLAPVERGRFELVAGAGGGLDFLSSRLPDQATGWSPIPMAGLELGPRIRFGRGLALTFVADLWFDLVDTRFVGSLDEREFFDPVRARLGAQLRLSWGN